MLKKINLSEQAYDELVNRIVSGGFSAGETLQEEKLSAEFGISRTPVREALRRLAAEGLVELFPRCGYRVSLPDDEALDELYECRVGLELMALELAIGKIPQEEISALKRKLENAVKKRNVSLVLAADSEMHELIADCSGNRYLASLVRQFMRKTAPFRHVLNRENPEKLTGDRLMILDAVAKRDRERSAVLLREHIMRGRRREVYCLGN